MGLNSEVNLVSNHRILANVIIYSTFSWGGEFPSFGRRLPALTPSAMAKPPLGPALGQGKGLLGQGSLCHGIREQLGTARGIPHQLLESCCRGLCAQRCWAWGQKENCLFPEPAVCVLGFVLNKGMGITASAGIQHTCPVALGEKTALFFLVCFTNILCKDFFHLGLWLNYMKTGKTNFWVCNTSSCDFYMIC